jgi:hypothetical protein
MEMIAVTGDGGRFEARRHSHHDSIARMGREICDRCWNAINLKISESSQCLDS